MALYYGIAVAIANNILPDKDAVPVYLFLLAGKRSRLVYYILLCDHFFFGEIE